MAKPINIFIIYAREDKEEKRILLDFLSPMIEPYNLNIWHDDHIQPGQEWKPHIESRLNITDIFILLVSVNFLNSKFIKQVEFKYALDRHRENKSVVIPVIIKYCLWEEPLPYDNYSFSLAQLQVLPTEGKPIIEWRSADEAYSNIAKGIRSVIIERRANQKKQELQEEEFWNHAVQKNSVSSYNEYIQNYPEGKFYEEAKSAVIIFEEKEKERIERNKQEIEKAKTEFERQKIEEEILWKSTCDINTLDAYNNYLEKSKLGSYSEQANKSIAEIEKKNREIIAEQQRLLEEEQEHKLWEKTVSENAIPAYQKYLQSTTLGLFKEKAQQCISQLNAEQKEKEEQQLWENTKAKSSLGAYYEYLQEYPNGIHLADALAFIQATNNRFQQIKTKEAEERVKNENEYKLWEEATGKNSISSYQKYLQETVTGLHKAEAQQFINNLEKEQREKELEASAWKNVKAKNTLNALNQYIQQYPNGIYHDDALAAIKANEDNEEQKAIGTEKRENISDYETTKKNNKRKYIFIGTGALIVVLILWKMIGSNSEKLNNENAKNNIDNQSEAANTIKDRLDKADTYFNASQYDSAGSIYRSIDENELNPVAMFNIGYMYEYGHGVVQDYAQAKMWYEKACDAGDKDGCSKLKNF